MFAIEIIFRTGIANSLRNALISHNDIELKANPLYTLIEQMLGKKKFYRILGNLRDLLSLRKLDAPQEIGASKCNYCGIVFPYEHIDRHPICTQCGSNSFGPYKTEIGPNKDNQLARNLLDKVIAY